jgi:hypothetical protein
LSEAPLFCRPLLLRSRKRDRRRSRGTPRIANSLLRRVRDFAQVLNDGQIDIGITQHSLKALNVDEHGLDEMDNRILSAIIDKFKGGPVGLTTIATAVGEEAGNHRRSIRTVPDTGRFPATHAEGAGSYSESIRAPRQKAVQWWRERAIFLIFFAADSRINTEKIRVKSVNPWQKKYP